MLLSLNKIMSLLLALSWLLSACGKKKTPDERGESPNPDSYIPKAWDLTSDWPDSALKAKDLVP